MPRLCSSAATLAVVRRVHFKPVTGSPAVSCAIRTSSRAMTPGVFFRRPASATGPSHPVHLDVVLNELSSRRIQPRERSPILLTVRRGRMSGSRTGNFGPELLPSLLQDLAQQRDVLGVGGRRRQRREKGVDVGQLLVGNVGLPVRRHLPGVRRVPRTRPSPPTAPSSTTRGEPRRAPRRRWPRRASGLASLGSRSPAGERTACPAPRATRRGSRPSQSPAPSVSAFTPAQADACHGRLTDAAAGP